MTKVPYMITFTSPKDFDKFLKHIKLIRVIKYLKPESVYELAKVMKVDVSNLNKFSVSSNSLHKEALLASAVSKIKFMKVSWGRLRFVPRLPSIETLHLTLVKIFEDIR